jgi:threonine aldolase
MDFGSDNMAGASDKVLAAITAANAGPADAYGGDALTARVREQLAALFEHEVAAFLVATGTAANALALAALTPPWGSVLAHEEAHVAFDECGAPEFFTGGAKIVAIPGEGGKLTPAAVAAALDSQPPRPPHTAVPAVLSLSQATEAGTAYTPAEVAALAAEARRRGMAVHMDGARFASALLRLGASPAEMTWKAGVDVISLGATKNGCLAAEAVVVFDPERAATLPLRIKRAGHLVSKSRFLAAQFAAWLDRDHWRDLAARANGAADRLAGELQARGIRLAFPLQANELFAVLPLARFEALRAAGIDLRRWPTRSLAPAACGAGEVVTRLITSFATSDDDINRLLAGIDRVG